MHRAGLTSLLLRRPHLGIMDRTPRPPHSALLTPPTPPVLRYEFAIFIINTFKGNSFNTFPVSIFNHWGSFLKCSMLCYHMFVYHDLTNVSCRYSQLFTAILISRENLKFSGPITSSLIFPNKVSLFYKNKHVLHNY